MSDFLPPDESSVEELQRAWAVKNEQVQTELEIKRQQIEDHRDFLDKRQVRLEEWEKTLTEIDGQKHYTIYPETGRLGAIMEDAGGNL